MTRHAKVADAPIDLSRRWNHNTHYRRIVLDALHSGARTALDVGAGDGLLAAELREQVPVYRQVKCGGRSVKPERGAAPGGIMISSVSAAAAAPRIRAVAPSDRRRNMLGHNESGVVYR